MIHTNIKNYNLTPKSLKVLSTLAMHDVTLKQAADLLCISIDTANQHVALARRALGVRNTNHAIYVATQNGLITNTASTSTRRHRDREVVAACTIDKGK